MSEVVSIASSDSDECRVISDEEEEGDDEDPCNSGMHVNDALNIRHANGSVLVNTGHPEDDEDIHIASQISALIKPHQVASFVHSHQFVFA